VSQQPISATVSATVAADVCCIQVKAGGVGHDASKVKVYGDGVKPTGVLASLPVSFTVDTSQAGVADVDILIEVCHFYTSIYCIEIARNPQMAFSGTDCPENGRETVVVVLFAFMSGLVFLCVL